MEVVPWVFAPLRWRNSLPTEADGQLDRAGGTNYLNALDRPRRRAGRSARRACRHLELDATTPDPWRLGASFEHSVDSLQRSSEFRRSEAAGSSRAGVIQSIRAPLSRVTADFVTPNGIPLQASYYGLLLLRRRRSTVVTRCSVSACISCARRYIRYPYSYSSTEIPPSGSPVIPDILASMPFESRQP